LLSRISKERGEREMSQEDRARDKKEKDPNGPMQVLKETATGADILAVYEAWNLTFVCRNVSQACSLANLIQLKKILDGTEVNLSVRNRKVVLSTSSLEEREKIKDWVFRSLDDLGYQIETYQLIPKEE